MKPRPVFSGFHPEAFRFFRRLARNNHKLWFDKNRHIYEQHVAGTLKGLFETLVPAMLDLHPDFDLSGKSGRNFSRINRDIRFARDKSPYRKNLYLLFGQRSSPKMDTRLYVGLSADGVSCGFATYNGRGTSLERLLKPRRARDPKRLETMIARLARSYEMYWHANEKGAWTKFPGPPRSDRDWKRCRAWIVRKVFPSTQARLHSPAFARQVGRIFRQLFPLYAVAALEEDVDKKALRRGVL